MKNIINIICAAILIISFLFCPIAILLVTHSTLGTFESVTILVMDLVLFLVALLNLKK